MPLKTIFVGPSFDSTVEGHPPAVSLVRYAIALAESQSAHLSICVGVFKINVHSAIVEEARDLIAAVNNERRQHAVTFAEDLMRQVEAAGLIGNIEIAHDGYGSVTQRFVQMSRLADVAVLEPNSDILSLQKGLIEEVLFGSGRPVIVVPREWTKKANPERILVAWDGSAKAARAIGDALPLLMQAMEVEVVAVSGDPDDTKRIDGADIAPHLARHCPVVKVTQLHSSNGDIAATLGDHAKLSRADLLVMGAYAHAKIMQVVFGGVTRSMIDAPPIPVYLSY
jgi:nucleotide-binding universal stress UspA family protein